MDKDLVKSIRLATLKPTGENLAKLGRDYLRSLNQPVPPLVRLIGRRWFQKTHGNTYHTVEVHIDDELIGHSPVTYGYGNQYEDTGMEMVFESGKVVALLKNERLWEYKKRTGMVVKSTVSDVKRKRDL